MIERILVPLDGSEISEAILPEIRRLLRRADAEIILVGAIHIVPIGLTPHAIEIGRTTTWEYVEGVRKDLEKEGIRARCHVKVGTAAQVIVAAAESERANLIAMATHGRTGLMRLLLGSEAETVLRTSPVPVLAARPSWSYQTRVAGRSRDLPFKNILVPLDGSSNSLAVIPHAIEFGKLFDARAVILSVVDPAAGTQEEDDRELAQAQIHDAARRFDKAGIEAMTVVNEGAPAAKIAEMARDHGVDLIAMATHGRTGVARLFMGSVTESVLRDSAVPMLIARAYPAEPQRGLVKAVTERK